MKAFDTADLALVSQQWADAAIEKLDIMAASPSSSVLDLRDSALFLSGCFCGVLQAHGIAVDVVNQHVFEFQQAMDAHLLALMPEHEAMFRGSGNSLQ